MTKLPWLWHYASLGSGWGSKQVAHAERWQFGHLSDCLSLLACVGLAAFAAQRLPPCIPSGRRLLLCGGYLYRCLHLLAAAAAHVASGLLWQHHGQGLQARER